MNDNRDPTRQQPLEGYFQGLDLLMNEIQQAVAWRLLEPMPTERVVSSRPNPAKANAAGKAVFVFSQEVLTHVRTWVARKVLAWALTQLELEESARETPELDFSDDDAIVIAPSYTVVEES